MKSLGRLEESNSTSSLVDRLGACPCCNSNNLQRVTSPSVNIGMEHFAPIKDLLGMSECESCGLAFCNPRPSEDMLVSYYNKDGYDCHNPEFEADIAESGENARLSLIEEVSPKSSLLDFGAGPGHLLRFASKRQWKHVSGIEAGAIPRQKLTQAGFDVYESLRSWQEKGKRTDVVTMVHVLEHLTDASSMLGVIHEILLESGGIFYVEVPNADSLRARLALSPLKPLWTANAERYLAFPIHLLYFNPLSLRRFLEKHNFRVLKMGTLGLGVEELFAKPKSSSTGCAPATQLNGRSFSEVNKRSRVPTLFKDMIKNTISSLRLGENLYAICKAS